jgi:hypothetical protein
MVIYGSHMFEFSFSKNMSIYIYRIATRLCLTLIIKGLKISVEHGRVVTTVNLIKYEISYLV